MQNIGGQWEQMQNIKLDRTPRCNWQPNDFKMDVRVTLKPQLLDHRLTDKRTSWQNVKIYQNQSLLFLGDSWLLLFFFFLSWLPVLLPCQGTWRRLHRESSTTTGRNPGPRVAADGSRLWLVLAQTGERFDWSGNQEPGPILGHATKKPPGSQPSNWPP